MRRKCEMSVTCLVLVNDGEWVPFKYSVGDARLHDVTTPHLRHVSRPRFENPPKHFPATCLYQVSDCRASFSLVQLRSCSDKPVILAVDPRYQSRVLTAINRAALQTVRSRSLAFPTNRPQSDPLHRNSIYSRDAVIMKQYRLVLCASNHSLSSSG